jgi:hypothetical protein
LVDQRPFNVSRIRVWSFATHFQLVLRMALYSSLWGEATSTDRARSRALGGEATVDVLPKPLRGMG